MHLYVKHAGDLCLGKLSVGVENVVKCPANCSAPNASVLWCLNPPGICLDSKHGERFVGSAIRLYVNETGEMIVEEIPSTATVVTNCTYQLESVPVCEPVSFEMTQRIGMVKRQRE